MLRWIYTNTIIRARNDIYWGLFKPIQRYSVGLPWMPARLHGFFTPLIWRNADLLDIRNNSRIDVNTRTYAMLKYLNKYDTPNISDIEHMDLPKVILNLARKDYEMLEKACKEWIDLIAEIRVQFYEALVEIKVEPDMAEKMCNIEILCIMFFHISTATEEDRARFKRIPEEILKGEYRKKMWEQFINDTSNYKNDFKYR